MGSRSSSNTPPFPTSSRPSPRRASISSALATSTAARWRLPGYGAIITISRFGKRFERGLYPDADGFGFPLYVSRGIGMEGGSTPRVRFASRPEVALIELVPVAQRR